MTYIQNTHRFRGFKLTFADWLKFILIEELAYEFDVIRQLEKEFQSEFYLEIIQE
jgi:hypothetical protein